MSHGREGSPDSSEHEDSDTEEESEGVNYWDDKAKVSRAALPGRARASNSVAVA
jgi:hypothetical protein